MRRNVLQTVQLKGCRLEYRLVESGNAKHLRVRVRPQGVEVLLPKGRPKADVQRFLREKESWIVSQMNRLQKLAGIRKASAPAGDTILLRGERLQLAFERRKGSAINRVTVAEGVITVVAGVQCRTPALTTLINWLRRSAREEIHHLLPEVCKRLRRHPRKVFVMDQRTKWGNCSPKRILSFNWRIVMAPPFVMRYLVTHEVVHLAVPDHSIKFWLTLKGHCPDFEKARQWLAANGSQLFGFSTLEPSVTQPARQPKGTFPQGRVGRLEAKV